MRVTPYINFDGRCDEAIAFYTQAVGAELKFLMRFKEMPADGAGPAPRPEVADKVMHAQIRVGETDLMVSDGRCTGGGTAFAGVSMALAVPDPATADRAFAALADGGKVHMPLTKTFFSPSYGMLTDRFGLMWMVMVGP